MSNLLKKRIVLFGLSANPPTGLGGHMGIIHYFSSLFDEVWILPVYRHAYSSKRSLESFENRIKMLELSLKDCNMDNTNIYIKEYEKECFESLFPGCSPSDTTISFGSIDLVRWIKKKFPEIEFSMIVGEDAFNDICANKWKNSEELRQSIHFEILKRKGVDEETNCNHEGDWYTFHTQIALENVSSTAVRDTTDPAILNTHITPSVAKFLQDNHLYSFQ